jgi:hypothetical protein
MDAKTVAYWATTGLVSFAMLASGASYLSGAMNEAMIEHLGYPAHFVAILGTWKLLVAPGLLVPGFARVKQWTYAGLFFTLTGAATAHIAVGDGVGEVAAPLVVLALAAVSYALHVPVRFGGRDAVAQPALGLAAAS